MHWFIYILIILLIAGTVIALSVLLHNTIQEKNSCKTNVSSLQKLQLEYSKTIIPQINYEIDINNPLVDKYDTELRTKLALVKKGDSLKEILDLYSPSVVGVRELQISSTSLDFAGKILTENGEDLTEYNKVKTKYDHFSDKITAQILSALRLVLCTNYSESGSEYINTCDNVLDKYVQDYDYYMENKNFK